MSLADIENAFKERGRIVIVGASLAGLRAAEALRREGFRGQLIIVGEEAHEPYDRPPLSKQVVIGDVPADHTALPRLGEVDADWRLGIAATGLDLNTKMVKLANGDSVGFDRVLIATGTRARPWFNKEEAAIKGVLTLWTREDAHVLQKHLADKPRRVIIIGAGFTGSETASACRDLGLDVTVIDRGATPLNGALGGVLGRVAAAIQREHGVDLRCDMTVKALEADKSGKLCAAHLSDGSTLEAELSLIALGSIRNVEWLADSGLAVGTWGLACDTGCRAFDTFGIVTDDVFVAGDVSRSPQPLFDYQFLALEHWGNAIKQAEVAAHNMVNLQHRRRPHLSVPAFWSNQFDINIKSLGVPPFADEVMIVQGSTESRRFLAVYGHKGRIVAAVAFNHAKWLQRYEALIEEGATFPPAINAMDAPRDAKPVSAEFRDAPSTENSPYIAITGYEPSERRAIMKHSHH